MIRLIVRGLLARKLRTILTSIAIVLGVAMVAGTFILTDQITSAFDEIFQAGNEKIDAVVQRQTLFDSSEAEVPPLPESIVEQVRRTDGVAVADGEVQGQGQLLVNGEKVESTGRRADAGPVHHRPGAQPEHPVEGRLPENPGEVALIKDTADRKDITVGEPGVELATNIGAVPVKVVGIFKFGDKESVGRRDLRSDDPQRRAEVVRPRGRGVGGGGVRRAGRVAQPAQGEPAEGPPGHGEGRDRPGERAGPGGPDLERHQQLPVAGADDVRGAGAVRRRLHHLQHLLDHRRPAHPRVRDDPGARGDTRPGDAQRRSARHW